MAHPEGDAEIFVITLLKTAEGKSQEAVKFLDDLVASVRAVGGKVQARAQKPSMWDVLDGGEHFVAPNHLSPACFDFDCILVSAFPTTEEVHAWWDSDRTFAALAGRSAVEKLGVYIVEGLASAFDIQDREKFQFGEKFLIIEFIAMLSFKPVQRYVDNYKRYSHRAINEAGVDCNTIFAEGVSGMLMNEFPLDACVASPWRLKTDAHYWYESDIYQKMLMPIRKEFSRSLALLIPINDDPPSLVSKGGSAALMALKA